MSSSSIEDIKGKSHRLRGSLLESLANPTTGALGESDQTLIKYHGSYQQDDRDLREERRRQKLEPAYQFMIRTRTPGGVITPQQWLQLDAIATRYANHSLRVTTRQAFQFHGVIKRELKTTMQAINAALIDTLAACGDVNRNVQVAANPLLSRAHADLYTDAAHLSEHLLPNTRAYYEIWLDEKRSLVPVRKRNQSTARTIYRVNSKSVLPHHQSTMSMYSPTTWGLSQSSLTTLCLAITSLSAAEWGQRMVTPTRGLASATSSASSPAPI